MSGIERPLMKKYRAMLLEAFEPAPLRVLLHRTTENVDIQVDFHNLPPVPWR